VKALVLSVRGELEVEDGGDGTGVGVLDKRYVGPGCVAGFEVVEVLLVLQRFDICGFVVLRAGIVM
jgi:hypothetical protein